MTSTYPASVGLIDEKLFGQERWYHQMFFLFIQSSREHTALKFGGSICEGPEPIASLNNITKGMST